MQLLSLSLRLQTVWRGYPVSRCTGARNTFLLGSVRVEPRLSREIETFGSWICASRHDAFAGSAALAVIPVTFPEVSV